MLSTMPWTKLFAMIFGMAAMSLTWMQSEVRFLRKEPIRLQEFKLSSPPPACARWKEHMPTSRDPTAYQTYMKARKTWRSKIEWQLTHAEATAILTGVRTAAEMGDWGARALMAKFYLQGLGVLETNRVLEPDPEKAVAIVRTAAALNQPWGLYDLGVAHQYGYGGARQSDKLAWAYFLKAAKLGSPEAQMALASAYIDARQFDSEEKMLQCAYQQRHGEAAQLLGVDRQVITGDYIQAIKFFQDGVEFGDRDSAVALRQLFAEGFWSHMGDKYKPRFQELGIISDAERSRRYSEIAIALELNPDLRLTRLNEVVPLPPAKMPPWKGVAAALEVESDAPPKY
jgi:TPR repeat protein